MNIKIRNAKWQIKFVDEVDDFDSYGLTKTDKKQIFIRNNQTPTETKDTIAHELTHAYLYECGHYLTREESEQIATFVGRNFEEMQINFTKILNEKGV